MIEQFPKISIVTPSFNQGQFLEDTITSILSQNYPQLEYIIIDGGSMDNSIEIIRQYQDKLAYWVSEVDGGQYDAINKGFQKSTGEIMAWLNSDDKYVPWTFEIVSDIFKNLPEVEWLTTLSPLIWDKSGKVVYCDHKGGYNRQGFMSGENLPIQEWYNIGCIQQESVFWRRSLWEKTGSYLDSSYHLAGDFELWARFYQSADLYTVEIPLGGFRNHGNQRSVIHYDQYLEEAKNILKKYGGYPASKSEAILRKIFKDYIKFPYKIRRLALKLNLKSPHKLCVYSTLQNVWKIEEI